MAQVSLPLAGPRHFGQTSRRDGWWLTPLLVFLGLSAFIVYATWAAFQGNYYWYAEGGAHYLSPFYSPELFGASPHSWRMKQEDVDRVQEFRKCVECYLCQDVCHVLREHRLHDRFVGPRFLVHLATLEMSPLETGDRHAELRDAGIGYCNITKCCTHVCPEGIHITDNAIIPQKERVVDEYYDPLTRLFRMFKKK